jgi:hypothetical protein
MNVIQLFNQFPHFKDTEELLSYSLEHLPVPDLTQIDNFQVLPAYQPNWSVHAFTLFLEGPIYFYPSIYA